MKKVILRLFFVLLTAGFIFHACIPQTFAAEFKGSVTLKWLPNSEPDLAGYRAFVREGSAGYDYKKPAWEGTETTCQIKDLDVSKSYYFVLRAFDTEGYESGNSNEVSLVKGTVPDGTPPIDPKTVTITVTVELPQ